MLFNSFVFRPACALWVLMIFPQMLKGNLFVFGHLGKMTQSQQDLLLVRHHQYLLVLSCSPVSQVFFSLCVTLKVCLSTQMAPAQWRMEEGSQSWGGSQPWWWGTDWGSCVTTKLEAKLFSPTTKPPSSFTSELPVPYMSMSRPESIGFHSSALSLISHFASFHPSLAGQCWYQGKGVGWGRQRGSAECGS